MADGNATAASGAERLTPHARAGLILLALVVQGVAYWWSPMLFSNDGPQHLLQAWVSNHIDEPAVAADWVANTPLTSHGYHEVFILLEGLLGWRNAHAFGAWLPLAVALCGWLLLATRERAGSVFRVAVLTGCSLSWIYWIGLLPFMYALAFVPFVVVLTLKWPTKSAPLVALLLALQCWCHPFPAVLTGGVVFAMSLAGGWRAVLRTVLVGLPSAVIARGVQTADYGLAGEATWEFEDNVFRQFFIQYIPGPLWFSVFFSCCLVWIVVCWYKRSSTRSTAEKAAFAVGLLLVLLTPAVPFSWNGWELVRGRLIPVGLPLVVALAPAFVPTVARLVLTPLAVLGSAAYLSWVASTSSALMHAYNDLYDVLEDQLPSMVGMRWELVVFEMFASPDPVPVIDYYGGTAHIAQLLSITHGGAPNYTQAIEPPLHWMLYKRPENRRLGDGELILGESLTLWGLFADQPERRALEIQGQLAHSFAADVFVIAGRDTDAAAVASAGYAVTPLAVTPAGLHISLARKVGCDVTIEVDAAVADVVEAGITPRPGVVEAFAVPAGRSSWTFEGARCGTWWLRSELPMASTPRGEVVVEIKPPTALFQMGHVVAQPPQEPPPAN